MPSLPSSARTDGKDGPLYLVSRRNVDKTTMSASDFVLVTGNESKVEYFGDVKPSVDAPIQIRLFNYYEGVCYMVHGHVYGRGNRRLIRLCRAATSRSSMRSWRCFRIGKAPISA